MLPTLTYERARNLRVGERTDVKDISGYWQVGLVTKVWTLFGCKYLRFKIMNEDREHFEFGLNIGQGSGPNPALQRLAPIGTRCTGMSDRLAEVEIGGKVDVYFQYRWHEGVVTKFDNHPILSPQIQVKFKVHGNHFLRWFDRRVPEEVAMHGTHTSSFQMENTQGTSSRAFIPSILLWACPKCTLDNSPFNENCEICGCARVRSSQTQERKTNKRKLQLGDDDSPKKRKRVETDMEKNISKTSLMTTSALKDLGSFFRVSQSSLENTDLEDTIELEKFMLELRSQFSKFQEKISEGLTKIAIHKAKLEGEVCTICNSTPKTVALNPCGHKLCGTCAERVRNCPWCKKRKLSVIKLFG